jgi:hypothetical protein
MGCISAVASLELDIQLPTYKSHKSRMKGVADLIHIALLRDI